MPAEANQTPPERIGAYRILGTLGQGGMGVVYLAEQEEPVRRRVALKVVRTGLDTSEVLQRFEAERQALALMDHPGIAKVFDAGRAEDGRPWFAMEWVAGVPITEHCDRERLTSRQRLELFVEVCEAIQHAHAKGVLHRDIKPSNILVTEAEGRARPKVIDFGVAKAIGSKLTEETLYTAIGLLVGTPGYMSPEQAEPDGEGVDTRSDIYSLGVLLYELLTGEPPFPPGRLRREGWASMVRIIQQEEPRRPSSRVRTLAESTATEVALRRRTEPRRLAKELRGDLDWITLKALEKDRTRRYQSAYGLGLDVQRHLRDEPVVASPPSLTYRMGKTVRRHRLAFAALGAVLLSLVAGLVASTVLYVRAEAARQEARRQVVRLNVAKGMELVDRGHHVAALPWLVEALRLEEDERRVEAHRLRIGTTLERLPGLYRMWHHGGNVRTVAFSPDGRLVASGSSDGTARVWNVEDGTPYSPVLRHEDTVQDLAIAPDGAWLLTGSEDGKGRLWELPSGDLRAVLSHGGPVLDVDACADGNRVLTASQDGSTGLWDARTWELVARIQSQGALTANVACSSDSGMFLTAGDHGVRLWHTSSGEAASPLLPVELPLGAVLSSDGRRVAAAGADGCLSIWDIQTDNPAVVPLCGGTTGLYSPVFNPAYPQIAVASFTSAVFVWNLSTGRRNSLTLDAGAATVRFSPDGLLIATGDLTGGIRLWNAATAQPYGPPVRHPGATASLEFDNSGRLLVSGGFDGTVRVWDLAQPTPTHPLRPGSAHSFDPEGRVVSTTFLPPTDEYMARVWETDTGDPAHPPFRHADLVQSSVALRTPLLATASYDKTARLWHMTDGEPRGPALRHDKTVVKAVFAPEAAQLATLMGRGDTDRVAGGLRLWSLPGLEELSAVPYKGEGIIDGRFSPDGHYLVTAGWSGAQVWDVSARHPVSPLLRGGLPAGDADFSPDGHRLAATFQDGMLMLASMPTGVPLCPPMHEPSIAVGIRFSRDGSRLVSGSLGGNVQVWDGYTGEARGPVMDAGSGALYPSFSPDDRWVVAASRDGAVRVWDAETAEALTPRLRNDTRLDLAEFSPDGHSVSGSRVWELHPEERAIEDLRLLAQVLAGHRLEEDGALRSLSSEEIQSAWKDLRGRYPHSFEATALQVHAWHREKARELAFHGRWADALPHLDAALELGPETWRLLYNRARTHAELGHWDAAAQDFAAAQEKIPGELEPLFDLALIQLASGDPTGYEEFRKAAFKKWAETRNPDRARWAAQTALLAPLGDPEAQARALEWEGYALEVEPERPERLAQHGAALLRAGRLEEAVAALQNALEKSEGSRPPAAPAWLALALHKLGRASEAARWRARAERTLRRLEAETPVLTEWEETSGQGRLVPWEQRAVLRVLLAELDRTG